MFPFAVDWGLVVDWAAGVGRAALASRLARGGVN
jgi:hypothetical protein